MSFLVHLKGSLLYYYYCYRARMLEREPFISKWTEPATLVSLGICIISAYELSHHDIHIPSSTHAWQSTAIWLAAMGLTNLETKVASCFYKLVLCRARLLSRIIVLIQNDTVLSTRLLALVDSLLPRFCRTQITITSA